MFFIFLVVLAAISMWYSYGRPALMRDFAALLEHPEFVEGAGNAVLRRWFLKGEFHGRKVVVLMQQQRRRFDPAIVLSMETRARTAMEHADLTGDRVDRE